jgi:ribosome-binding protein aMBF1 (putative translation factor)
MHGGIAEKTSRTESLTEFRIRLSSVDLTHDASFQEAFNEAQTLLELSDTELADKLLVSRPTVNRWVRGRNLPRRALRRSIVNWMDDQLAQRIRILEQHATRSPSSNSGGRSWHSGEGVAVAAKGR